MAALGPPLGSPPVPYATPGFMAYHGYMPQYQSQSSRPPGSRPPKHPGEEFGIFLGSLPEGLTREHIMSEAQNVPGGAASARVITDKDTGLSKGFGFVNFFDANGMKKGLQHFNGLQIMGATISARPGNKSRSSRASAGPVSAGARGQAGSIDIYIGGIPEHLTEQQLQTNVDMLCGFPCINLCKKVGFAFATYRSLKESEDALRALNGRVVAGARLTCQPAKKKCDKSRMQRLFDLITEGLGHDCPLSTQQLFMLEKSCRTVWLGSLPELISERQLTDAFREHGELVDVSIVRDSTGSRAGYGFVEYRKPEYAALAITKMKYQPLCGQHVDMQPAKAPRDIVGTSGNSGITNSDGEPTEFLLNLFKVIHQDKPNADNVQYFQDPVTGQMYACSKAQAAEYLAQQSQFPPAVSPPTTYAVPGQPTTNLLTYQPQAYPLPGLPAYQQPYQYSQPSAAYIPPPTRSPVLSAARGLSQEPSPSPPLVTYGKYQSPLGGQQIKYSPY